MHIESNGSPIYLLTGTTRIYEPTENQSNGYLGLYCTIVSAGPRVYLVRLFVFIETIYTSATLN